jgi:hypothetical protein
LRLILKPIIVLFLDWLRDSAILGGKNKSTQPEFSMDDFLQGRTNEEVYSVFFDRFIKAIGKKTTWNTRVMEAKSDRGICSVSDEAFTLLLLENNFDRWLDIFDMNKGQVSVRRGQKTRKFESDVATKYTRGGHVYKATDKTKEVKGWSSTGIERFNFLFDKVRKDRKDNTGFTAKWLKERKEMVSEAMTPTKKRKRSVVQARNELESDEGEEGLEGYEDDAIAESSDGDD